MEEGLLTKYYVSRAGNVVYAVVESEISQEQAHDFGKNLRDGNLLPNGESVIIVKRNKKEKNERQKFFCFMFDNKEPLKGFQLPAELDDKFCHTFTVSNSENPSYTNQQLAGKQATQTRKHIYTLLLDYFMKFEMF